MLNITQFPDPPSVEKWEGDAISLSVGVQLIAKPAVPLVYKEKNHPPTFYIAIDALGEDAVLENKGVRSQGYPGPAEYLDLVLADGTRLENVGWTYPDPVEGFEMLKGYAAFHADRGIDCFIDDEKVTAEQNGFGGWIWSGITSGEVDNTEANALVELMMDAANTKNDQDKFAIFIAVYNREDLLGSGPLPESLGSAAMGGFGNVSGDKAVEALLYTVANIANDVNVSVSIEPAFRVRTLSLEDLFKGL